MILRTHSWLTLPIGGGGETVVAVCETTTAIEEPSVAPSFSITAIGETTTAIEEPLVAPAFSITGIGGMTAAIGEPLAAPSAIGEITAVDFSEYLAAPLKGLSYAKNSFSNGTITFCRISFVNLPFCTLSFRLVSMDCKSTCSSGYSPLNSARISVLLE